MFGNVQMDAPSALREALSEIYLRFAPELGGRPPEHSYLPDGLFQAYFEQSALFGPVRHLAYPWARRFSAQSYVEYLASVSRYQMLDASRREALLVSIGEAVDAYGGAFDLPLESIFIWRRSRRRYAFAPSTPPRWFRASCLDFHGQGRRGGRSRAAPPFLGSPTCAGWKKRPISDDREETGSTRTASR